MDYQVVTPIAAAVPGVFLLLKLTYHLLPAAIGVAKAFFSISVHNTHEKQFAFSWQGRQYTLTVLVQGYVNSPVYVIN